jgi:hypothetical protein
MTHRSEDRHRPVVNDPPPGCQVRAGVERKAASCRRCDQSRAGVGGYGALAP